MNWFASTLFPSGTSIVSRLIQKKPSPEQIKSQQRKLDTMDSDGSFCTFWTQNEQATIHDLDSHACRLTIVQDACDPKKVGPQAFPGVNFAEEDLTEERVDILYSLIDSTFFHGTLRAFVTRRTCGLFRLKVHDSIPDEEDTVAFFESALDAHDWKLLKRHTQGNGAFTCPVLKKTHRFIGIRVQRNLWSESSINRHVDGLPNHDNKLFALVATLCHEFTHVLSYFLCNDHEHTQAFLNMNASLFGHSSRSYTSEDKPLTHQQLAKH